MIDEILSARHVLASQPASQPASASNVSDQDSFPSITEYVEAVPNDWLRGYCYKTLSHAFQTARSLTQLANQCWTGSQEKLGSGPISDLLTLPCIAGGMAKGAVTGILSLGTRLGDNVGRLVHATGAEQGAAVADSMFLGIELAGYGGMASSFVKGPASPAVVQRPPAGGGLAPLATLTPAPPIYVYMPPFPQPSVGILSIPIAVGTAVAVVSSANSSSFGGPMATPKPVQMSPSGDKHGLYSKDEAMTGIQTEIRTLKQAEGEWSAFGTRVENLLTRALTSGRRSTDVLRPLYAILRSRHQDLNIQQIKMQLDAYEIALKEGRSFSPINEMRQRMTAPAKRAALPPRQPKISEIRIQEIPAGSVSMITLVNTFNRILDEFRRRNYSNIKELKNVVGQLIKHYDFLPPGNNVADTLVSLGETGYRSSGHLRRACVVDPLAVKSIEHAIEGKFGSASSHLRRPVGGRRKPTLEELDRDPSAFGE